MDELGVRYDRAVETLHQAGQGQLLSFYGRLDDAQRAHLLDQIEAQDWSAMMKLVKSCVRHAPKAVRARSIEPAPYYPADPGEEWRAKYAAAREAGRAMLREGRVAAFTVAGGQGTRLGWDGPKGMYPASPIRGASLFQLFAEQLRKTAAKFGRAIPWYIMTSPQNHEATRDYFAQQNLFGLGEDDVSFFPQGVMPTFSTTGAALLESESSLALNPDGHGGSLRALYTSGALEEMRSRGVERISYFQVDNPLVRCLDPLFLGLHALDGAQMSSKMVAKAYPGEKVGVFAVCDGRVRVIEYSDLPQELNDAEDEDGRLLYRAGSIAVHVIDVAFVEWMNTGTFALPWHRALKKVSYMDPETGERVEPQEPNAVKLETFVFDALSLCEKTVVLETRREEEFAPIKNAEGADSPRTSIEAQSNRAARWLGEAGVYVPHAGGHADVTLDLSPLTAVEPQDLVGAKGLPYEIEPGAKVTL